jgi:hypothetical protein
VNFQREKIYCILFIHYRLPLETATDITLVIKLNGNRIIVNKFTHPGLTVAGAISYTFSFSLLTRNCFINVVLNFRHLVYRLK